MTVSVSPASRFREFRERAGLSHDEVAHRSGFPSACIWDIESYDGDLTGYSPIEMSGLCRILGVGPAELFGGNVAGAPLSALDLVRLIHEQCRLRGVTLEQFEDTVGWRLGKCIEPPERLLEDMSIDGLQWLCREVGVDWRRVLLSL
jgi:transcriptional regulator with XRE-family HTH domain